MNNNIKFEMIEHSANITNLRFAYEQLSTEEILDILDSASITEFELLDFNILARFQKFDDKLAAAIIGIGDYMCSYRTYDIIKKYQKENISDNLYATACLNQERKFPIHEKNVTRDKMVAGRFKNFSVEYDEDGNKHIRPSEVVLNLGFIHEYKYGIDWSFVCEYAKMNELFLLKHFDFLDWEKVIKHQILTERFLDLFKDNILEFDKLKDSNLN